MSTTGTIYYYRGDPPAYHGGAFEINVKRRDAYQWADVPGATDKHTEAAWELLSWDWWQNILPEIWEDNGFNPQHLTSGGRSDGYVVHRMQGEFRYLEDEGFDTHTIERIEELAAELVASMPGEDEWRELVERYRDQDTLAALSAGQACPSCGTPR